MAFYVQSVMLAPCVLAICFTKKEYMDIEQVAKEIK